MPWDPSSDQTFGEWLRGGAPLGRGRTADVVTGERTWATRDQHAEWATRDGSRFKAIRDQAGNIVTHETTPRGRERKHVHIGLS